MKKFFFTFLCLLICSLFQTSVIYADENENIGKSFSQFDLLESYLTDHKQKISSFKARYNITENKELDLLLIEIDNLINISKKIKNNNGEGYNKSDISSYIVNRIKIINDKLKLILTSEKENYQARLEKKASSYSKLGIKVGNYLINIIEELANTVTKSDIIVEKKLKIVIHLKNLQKNSLALKDFGNTKYTSEQKLQEDFVFILKEIISDMANIKKILKSN